MTARAVPSPLARSLDPARLEVLWRNLLAVTDEAAWRLSRTAFSHAVREAWDFGVMLYDTEGRMLAQNSSVAAKNALWHPLASEVVRRYGEVLRPGDVFITNEPWLSDGHLYDVSIVRPIFFDGRHVAFVECVEHLAEIGGIVSGVARDRFEEGLLIPLVRLVSAGDECGDVLAFVAGNVRTPREVLGDIRAMMAGAEGCERALRQMMQRHGLDTLDDLANDVIAGSEAAMRAGITAHLPPGRFEHVVRIDGDVEVRAAVEVGDGSVLVDLSGSSPQTDTGINSPLNWTYSWAVYAVKCLVAPDLAPNHGCFAPVRVSAPEGSVVNPDAVAPVRSRGVVGVQVPAAVFGALAQAVPDRVIAMSCAPTWAVRVHAVDPQGRVVSELIANNGGMGARPFADGLSATPFPNNAANVPVEIIEERLPLRVWERSLVTDSGGPGRFRGGLGQQQDIEVLPGARLRVTVQTNHVEHPPQGTAGGRAGQPGRLELNGERVAGNTALVLTGGDRLTLRLPGGGGSGDPLTRDPAAVADDLEKGFVSAEAAHETYGCRTDRH